MKRLFQICLSFAIITSAMALGAFNKTFNETYSIKPASNLGKAECKVCHARPRGGRLNPYGKDIEAAMKAANSKKLTPAILAKVESLDSDKDGKSNIDEIKADSTPGE